MNETRDLPKWLWLFLPFAIVPVQIAARLGGNQTYKQWMRGEVSVVEIGTVLWLAIAVIAGVSMLRARGRLPQSWLFGWILLLTLGCFYWGGEEASWGQSYAHWKSPEFFEEHNEQHETGLHNMSAVFDQTPRTVLTIGAMAALVIAFWSARQPERFGPGTKLHWIWPTIVCVPAALLGLTVGYPAKLYGLFGAPVPHVLQMQVGEFKEYFLAMFLMLYALSLRMRLNDASRSSSN